MRSNRTRMTKLTAMALMVCSFATTGCDAYGVLSSLNLSIIVPTGFGGAPGFYNPFGLTQALVNALIGANTPATDSDSDSSGDDSGSTVPTSIGAVSAALN